MNNLLGRQVDNNYMVRMYCIRGLGNMADIGENKVRTLGSQMGSADQLGWWSFVLTGLSVFHDHFECHVGWHGRS